jgi:isocitrate dehydrogenase kinase/phosphatase
MAQTSDLFEQAPGERGMVMIVFTLPSYDMVFKVIKDRFDPPKNTTREQVMACYDIVFRHDRAGRMADAQEFEHLAFDRHRFHEDLLAELLEVAGSTVKICDDKVTIAHLYIERQMIPLNLYLSRVDGAAADAVAIDYGQAIKDLAATNIFPGDLFLKNFGVTRHGRVIFYDYDELAFVTDCRFRRIPPPRSWEDEIASDPWYSVRESDVFPEQFERFLGLRPQQKASFFNHHQDLLTAEYWKQIQQRLRAGDVIDIYPYPRERSLPYHRKTT